MHTKVILSCCAYAFCHVAPASITFVRQEVRYVTPDLADRQFTETAPTSHLFAGSRQSSFGGTIEFSGIARTATVTSPGSLHVEVESTLNANVLVPFDYGDYQISGRTRAIARVYFSVTEPTPVLIQNAALLEQSGATAFWREDAISPQLLTYNSSGQFAGLLELPSATEITLDPTRTYAIEAQANLTYLRFDLQFQPPTSASRRLLYSVSVDVIPSPGIGALLGGLGVIALRRRRS